eukprot:11035479-Ditylum_brightwellii.AAC.1
MSELIKKRTDVELAREYSNKLQELIKAGYKPRVHWLYNEAPPSLKQSQLTQPYMHQINAAEWAINAFKEHFVARL